MTEGATGVDWAGESATLRRRRLAVVAYMTGWCAGSGGVDGARSAVGAMFEASLLAAAGLDSDGEVPREGRFDFDLVREGDPTFDVRLGRWSARVPLAGLGSPRFDRQFRTVSGGREASGGFRGMGVVGATAALADPAEAALADEAMVAAVSGAASTAYPSNGFDVRRVGGELHLYRRYDVKLIPVGRNSLGLRAARKLDRGAVVGSILRVRKPREQDFDWVTPVLGWLAEAGG